MLVSYKRLAHIIFQAVRVSPGKYSSWYRLLIAILLILIAVSLGYPWTVQGQAIESLVVLPPDTTEFPLLSLRFKAHNDPGTSIDDLDLADLSVFENGRRVTALALDQQQAGVHFTLAINGDRRFDLRDAQGNSPYQQIQAVLSDWMGSRRFDPEDTLTLVTQQSTPVSNTIDRNAWLDALENYQPDFRNMVPDLVSLETALRLAEERVVPFGVDKVMLYITPPPLFEEINAITTLTEVARSAGIQVNVWMLGEEGFLATPEGGALIDLAARTGGEFFYVTGAETLPDPETYLEGLGVTYTLQFESGIRESGTYTIQVVADLPSGEWRGESGEFIIDVQPPKPILLSPPAVIVREPPRNWEGDLGDLLPATRVIEFLLEFPDDYPRDLVISRLVVDGQVVDMQDEAPFTTLTWDLTSLVETGEHVIQVDVEDNLGLRGETILTPIQVEVQLPEPVPPLSNQQLGMIVIAVILTATVILLIIWLTRHFLGGKLAYRMAKKIFDIKRKPGTAGNIRPEQAGGIFATLIPLDDPGFDLEHKAIPITRSQTAFGSDPERVDQVLDGEGIARLHARLRVKDGAFWLNDVGSDNGTWVNYALIGREPVQLHPGDLIHFGILGFRFTIIDASSPPVATVSKYEPLL
jgi:hypothetical protein